MITIDHLSAPLDRDVLHVVLVEPEIPPNTGNVARLCACTGCQLHLIHPLGFTINDRTLRRAGLDYWQYLKVSEYADWPAFRQRVPASARMYGFTTRGVRTLWQCSFRVGDVLVFGPETRGLPPSIRAQVTGVSIPMRKDAPVRSLNLASACAVAVYEALRQGAN
ncbi:MAG: tRNA (cytidine(34)-2'-O)-methyltransferase [Zetaproteobacteria bacterium]|nr:MAG: tRNA (cytidine(34)-2'-O)-methyltransferase [Zetaproteobacteria bacterium]